jgi:predicted Zn-dependent peptidase
MLATILGKGMSSRLFQKMREELGVCYYVYASQSPRTDRGSFSISAGVSNSRLAEAVAAILEEVKKIREELVDEKELQKAKDFRIGNLSLSLESSDSYADFYGFQEIMHEDIATPEERIAKTQAVTAEDVQAAARAIFKKETLNLAIVGPQKNEKELRDLIGNF